MSLVWRVKCGASLIAVYVQRSSWTAGWPARSRTDWWGCWDSTASTRHHTIAGPHRSDKNPLSETGRATVSSKKRRLQGWRWWCEELSARDFHSYFVPCHQLWQIVTSSQFHDLASGLLDFSLTSCCLVATTAISDCVFESRNSSTQCLSGSDVDATLSLSACYVSPLRSVCQQPRWTRSLLSLIHIWRCRRRG